MYIYIYVYIYILYIYIYCIYIYLYNIYKCTIFQNICLVKFSPQIWISHSAEGIFLQKGWGSGITCDLGSSTTFFGDHLQPWRKGLGGWGVGGGDAVITFECGFYMLPHVTTCLSSYPEGSHFPIRQSHPSQMSHLSDPISLCLPITFCSRFASKRPVPTLSLQRMRSQARKKRGHKRCTNLPNLGMQVYTRFGLLPDSRIKLQRGSKVAKQSEAKPSSLQREVLPPYYGETSLLS